MKAWDEKSWFTKIWTWVISELTFYGSICSCFLMILFLGVLAYKASTALPMFFETRLARAFQYTFQAFCFNPSPPGQPSEPGRGGAIMELMPLTSDQPNNREEPNAPLMLFNSEKPSVPIHDSPPPVRLHYPVLTKSPPRSSSTPQPSEDLPLCITQKATPHV